MTQNIIAKFKCHSVAPQSAESQHVRLEAVTDGCEENKSFSKWTPSGHLVLNITNPDLVGSFVEGEEYLLTITHAPKPAEGCAESKVVS